MTDDEFNQFITLLDAACASDDPKITKALKKFMFLVRLNISDDEMEEGPFTKMMETIDSLQRRVSQLEQPNHFTQTDSDWTQTTSSPQWIHQPTYTTGGTYTVPNTTTSSGTSITLTGGSSTTLGGSCTGFTTGTTTTTLINADDSAPKGTEIKEAIKDKLEVLLT
ncbi:MAG: hypothetical protein ACTSPB_20680 [Candidatus Thorarchaeota archaeon]